MPTPQPIQEQTQPLTGRFIVMPDVYVPKEKKKLSSTAVLAIVLAAVVVLVGIVLVLFFTRETPSAPLAQVPAQETPAVSQPAPTPEPTPEPPPQPTAPQATRVEIPTAVSGALSVGVDTDQDSLTDTEELIFSTSSSVPDTDQDSFLDGIELRNLYDPATPRALLEVSPRIKIARNESLGYQLLVPLEWTATKSTADGKEFIIRPDQGSESFRVTVHENVDRLGVTEWLQQQQPGINLTQFINFRNESNWVGVQSQDHTLVIATFDNGAPGSRALIFVMHYDAGQESILRFPAVWDMMTNSLSVATAPSSNTP